MTRRTFAPDAGGLISGDIRLAIGTAVIVTPLGHCIGSVLRVEAGFVPMLLGVWVIFVLGFGLPFKLY